jgi:NAD(P)-dependent dehydrogenase (short-subunit alcohol dehydrogenase family)
MSSNSYPTRTAIVTGASRGFGFELAKELAKRRWNLVVDARSDDDLDAAAKIVEAHGPGVVSSIAGDISDPAHQIELIATATSMGSLELVVNNASSLGSSPLPRLADYPIDALEAVFRVNVLGPLHLLQAALPHLREARGLIVNISSDAAVEGYEGWGGYGASKAALELMSKVLAVEESDVRVYWFDPGDMNTQMHQDAFPGEDIADRPLPETRVPALLRLIDSGMESGRYTAESILQRSAAG